MSFAYGTTLTYSISTGEPLSGPRIRCDRCGTTKSIFNNFGYPANWFLSNKSPRNWKTIFDKDVDEECEKVYRIDYCPKCKVGIGE